MKLRQLLKDYALPDTFPDIDVAAMTLDSRKLKAGDVFVALKGETVNGEDFIEAAVSAGASAVLKSGERLTVEYVARVPCIAVPELARNVSALAGIFYGAPSKKMQVFGVTGTNGKSTCVSLLAQACELLGRPAWQMGTVGYGRSGSQLTDTALTTPDAITCQKVLAAAAGEAECLAMEVSSHALVQNRVRGIEFTAAVFTNISRDHLDYHASFADYCEAKLSFLRDYQLQFAVVNLDDEFARRVVQERLLKETPTYSYSLNDSSADIYADSIQSDLRGTHAQINSRWGRGELRTSLVGEFNLSNLLAVIVTLAASGHALAEILEAVKALNAVEGRLQKVKCDPNTPAVFIDYAHTPDALLKALQALHQACPGELWVLFGCGGDRDKGKRALMAEVAEQNARRIFVTSDNPRSENPQHILDDIVTGFSPQANVSVMNDRKQAIEFAVEELPPQACLLIAGKGHEKYQIIGDQRLPFDDYLIAEQALQKYVASGRALQ